jgi:hypothetical protein
MLVSSTSSAVVHRCMGLDGGVPRVLDCLGRLEAKKRQQAIQAEADELDRMAASGLQAIVRDRLLVEDVFKRLLTLGTKAPDSLVSNVAQALVVFEQDPELDETRPKLEQSGYVIDYKGYEITYPEVPMFPNRWTVNLYSNNPHLLSKLGGRNVVIDDHASLTAAIDKAKRHVDALT